MMYKAGQLARDREGVQGRHTQLVRMYTEEPPSEAPGRVLLPAVHAVFSRGHGVDPRSPVSPPGPVGL